MRLPGNRGLPVCALWLAVCGIPASAATPHAPSTSATSVAPRTPATGSVAASAAPIPPARLIASYEPCYGRVAGQRGTIVIRRIVMADGTQKWLTVNTATLATAIVPAAGLRTQFDVDPTSLEGSASPKALDSLDDGSNYFALRREIADNYPRYRHGVSSHGGQGYMVTCDLCPSSRPLDRDFVEILSAHGVSPIYVCISGKWIERHEADLQWLLALKTPRILWVNHSLIHYYKPGAPDSVNFLNRPGTDLRREVLDNERLMVERGLTPTVFFRYPGLVSSPEVARAVLGWGLIPLGADAWLAKGERPRSGGIILVHINGNEPLGLKLLREWLPTTKMKAEEFLR